MEPRAVLEQRRLRANALTPYNPQSWSDLLVQTGLDDKYPSLPHMLHNGFVAGIPPIIVTYTPNNHTSLIEHHKAFHNNLMSEFSKGRYIGPFSKQDLLDLIGPFQTSPLSIIPKPNKPGKYRFIQNFSHPYTRSDGILSINSAIISENYPCTWGTFNTIAQLIQQLPPGSEAATRDVKEAYRTVPLAPSQWPGMVVKLSDEDSYAIDTQNAFGLASGAGIYGLVADAGMDIMRAKGLGPISKWVDDHLFIRIRREHLTKYNNLREQVANRILSTGGLRHNKGRLWFKGETLENGRYEEFDDDCSTPLRDLNLDSPQRRNQHDTQFTYSFDDIDTISDLLGIPWEKEKDSPFATKVIFIGFEWNLSDLTVSIPIEKRQKYLQAIKEWSSTRTHTLDEARKLHGKLLHASLILPYGRPYLIRLKSFLGVFRDSPFKPHTPHSQLQDDLQWWKDTLSTPTIERLIPGRVPVTDLAAYSDASSEVGIGITVGNRW